MADDIQSRATPAPRIGLALAWMGVALISFTLMAISGREAGRAIPAFELVCYRSLVSLVALLCVLWPSGSPLARFGTTRLATHAVRNVTHFFGQATWLMALQLIPLAQVFSFEFTGPLWVALMAPLVLGERLTRARMIAALLGFAGILIVARPGIATASDGTLLAATCAVFFAMSQVAMKLLVRTEPAPTILFHMMIMQAAIGFTLAGFHLTPPTQLAAVWIVVLGVTALCAHFALARAFTHADAIVVCPMDFLRLPLIVVVGALAYHEAVDPVVLIGATVIIAGNLINILGERWR